MGSAGVDEKESKFRGKMARSHGFNLTNAIFLTFNFLKN